MGLRRFVSPALVLFLLSPVVAELISGSSPPLQFFNPVLLLANLLLYGCGAILARELAFRWKKGWPSILLLGLAYGLVEEGLGLKSLYNPAYPGVDGSYGRWMGVNWLWTIAMITYHAVISIGVPILLVTLIFPDKRDEPWVKGRTMIILAALLALDAAFLNIFIAPYSPDGILYVLTFLAIAALAAAARAFPHPYFKPVDINAPKAVWLFIFGFVWTVLYYASILVPSALKLPVLATTAIILAYYALSALALLKLTGNGSAITDTGKLALAAGLVGIFILISPIRELTGARGMMIVGIGAAVFLYWLYRCTSEAPWPAL